jgi:hypothetical protein
LCLLTALQDAAIKTGTNEEVNRDNNASEQNDGLVSGSLNLQTLCKYNHALNDISSPVGL